MQPNGKPSSTPAYQENEESSSLCPRLPFAPPIPGTHTTTHPPMPLLIENTLPRESGVVRRHCNEGFHHSYTICTGLEPLFLSRRPNLRRKVMLPGGGVSVTMSRLLSSFPATLPLPLSASMSASASAPVPVPVPKPCLRLSPFALS